ncbi:MAG: hypothetical protein JXQ96_18985 [Cyclobacteriaceae bacterium]
MTTGFKVWQIIAFVLAIALSSINSLYAQKSNLHCKWIPALSQPIKLDTLLIAPETISFEDESVKFDLQMGTSKIQILDANGADSVRLCYRTLPAELTKQYQTNSYSDYDSLAPFKHAKKKVAKFEREELFKSEGISKSGSLTRGISFGNSRSLGVTSSLNFQMEGKLTNDLNIRANITDQNIPFQPEGNTQQLREFDNVSIEVYNENLSLRAGDIILQNPENYFLKYYKNVQGGQFNYNYQLGEKAEASSSVTIAAAKGQFADVTLVVQEGVQGPYKLRGPNGERFVIVLANSESIYLDGQLLERGFSQDYVIDYNLGEITFNPSVLITRFSRVRATYEYSDRNYNRSILNTNHSFKFGKTTLSFNHYQEQDSKNNPLSFDLSDQDKLLMSQAGDEMIPVPISGERESEYNENLVLYKKVDTVDMGGSPHQIFKISSDSSEVLYRVTFSEVGLGNGDYTLLSNTTNGRVFEWISPKSGERLGSYSAVLFVPAPNKKQMTTIGLNVATSEYSRVYSELALSNHDLNLFSDINNEDDVGMAVKGGYEIKQKPIGTSGKYKLSSAVDFEYDSENFQAIDRFRYIEYDRDWSYNPNQEEAQSSDHIFNVNTSLVRDRDNSFSYHLSHRKRGNLIDGTQQKIAAKNRVGAMQLQTEGFLMKNNKEQLRSDWKRFDGGISLDKYFIVPGYRFQLDQNELKLSENDSIISSAMNYVSHQFFLKSNDSLKTKFRLEYTQRKDKQPLNGMMEGFTSTRTTRLNVNSDIGSTNHIDLTFTYRNLQFLESSKSNPDEETVMSRLNWNGGFFNNHLRSDLTYVTSSSREIRREFVYIPVVTGEGTHTWRDLNDDGVQDITEFFEAINFDERNYIKLFVPTDDFISAFNNQLNWSVNASMPRTWKSGSGFLGMLGRLTYRASVTINKKNTDNSIGSRFNPFHKDTSDENLIFIRDAIRSNLFYNRSNPRFGFDVSYFYANSKQLISNGVDSRSQYEIGLNSRKKITSTLSVVWSLSSGDKRNASDFLEDRNYEIDIKTVAPQLIWQTNSSFRLSAKAEYKRKQNVLVESGVESSKLSSLIISSRWNKALQNSIDASFRYVGIQFNGKENTPAGYELLEALRPGSNFTWDFNFRQKLANGLQISLSYSGRKSIDQRVIHLGRMQVSALF